MMAVSSLQYTMGVSSGFKVYILGGQHSARPTERYRPPTGHGIPIYPIKRKLSPDPPHPQKRLCTSSAPSRQKPSHPPSTMRLAARAPPAGSSPAALAARLDLKSVLRRLIPDPRIPERTETRPTEEEQPLALVKRLEKPVEPPAVSPAALQQMRPSVITCISRPKASPPPTPDWTGPPPTPNRTGPPPTPNRTGPPPTPNRTAPPPTPDRTGPPPTPNRTGPPPTPDRTAPLQDSPAPSQSPRRCSPDVEEHFQRSLQSCGPWSGVRAAPSSVEDHFSKALGSQWLLIRAVADSPSSQGPPHRRQR